jgi:DNA-directed RNA polymerase I subunit RPA1
VHETPSIKKGYLSESTEPGEKGVWRLKTDGVNLQVLWKYADVLNLNQAYTNNIHAMANAYGIEAASKAIIKVRIIPDHAQTSPVAMGQASKVSNCEI